MNSVAKETWQDGVHWAEGFGNYPKQLVNNSSEEFCFCVCSDFSMPAFFSSNALNKHLQQINFLRWFTRQFPNEIFSLPFMSATESTGKSAFHGQGTRSQGQLCFWFSGELALKRQIGDWRYSSGVDLLPRMYGALGSSASPENEWVDGGIEG